jgi:methylmalonyl-CoA decarboxylase
MNNYKLIHVELKDSVGIIEFNNAKKLNALSKSLIEDILNAFAELNVPDVRCVILRAPNGSKVFSSGHDVSELPKDKSEPPLSYLDPLRLLTRTVQRYPKPVISMIQGSVWGGAFELIMSTDIVIASDKSTFAMTPVNLGVPYNIAGIHNLIRDAGLHVMKEVLFTANPISAEKALKIGLLNHIVPDDELEAKTLEIANLICEKAPLAIALIKEEMRILSEANAINPEEFERIQGLRQYVYESHDYHEGLAAFFEKRKPNFIGK